ncbi:MAG: nucleoside triphosphate pyrophosphohydrolase [Mycobacterium sp.]
MTVVLIDPRRPTLVSIHAVILLGGEVEYTEEISDVVSGVLRKGRPVLTGEPAPVLLSSNLEHQQVRARIAAGEPIVTGAEARPGERLVDAVEIMDRLRTAGPWESEQTHDSLRRYLLEETYELFDAVHSGSLDDVRDELGDVLLQVLFHARIAQESPVNSFTIDDVSDALVRKLMNRVPTVLAGEPITLEDQLAQWEQRKALERQSSTARSCVDGIPTGQPALALAQKVIARVMANGFPADLIPETLTSVSISVDRDAENDLRTTVLDFMDAVRVAERAIEKNHGATEHGAPTGPGAWRRFWTP